MKKDEFDTWLAHPVTELFFKAIREQVIEQTLDSWNTVSWGNEALWRNDEARFMRTAAKARVECAEDILSLRLNEEEDEQVEDTGD